LLERVTRENRFVQYLDLSQPTVCPIGITKTLGGLEYTVVVESISFDGLIGKGRLTASMSLRIPSSDKRLAFRAANVEFDERGITGGGGKLILLDNVSVPFGSGNALSIIADRGNTFVLFECSGYKSMGIEAELQFDKDLIEAVDFQGNVLPTPAKATFKGEFEHYGKMVATVNVTPFQLKSLQGFIFNVRDATYDNSDDLNALGMAFPPGYPRQDEGPLWKGVFIRNFSITFPETFKQSDNKRSGITVGASQVLIDENGFSGLIYAANLIPIDKGNMSGWAYAVDSVGLQIVVNQVSAFQFSGRVKISQMGERASPLRFSAYLRDERNYMFNIALTGPQEFEMLSAKLLLDANSSVSINVEDAKFRPKCNLNGTISINPGGGTNVYGLGFQGLQFQTVAPYVTIAGAALSCPNIEFKMKNFNISLSKINFRTMGNKLGLGFTVDVHLTPSASLGIGGKGAFTVWGKQEVNGEGKFVYLYDGL
ncbi:MAG: hypothetical protein K2Q22_09185, partial [Cytophagales bacterium]|nr:hypothetical protein [Cytophagales bacterium]